MEDLDIENLDPTRREAELFCLSAAHKESLATCLEILSDDQVSACRCLSTLQLHVLLQGLGDERFAQCTPGEIVSFTWLQHTHIPLLTALPAENWVHHSFWWFDAFSEIPLEGIAELGGPAVLLPLSYGWLEVAAQLRKTEEGLRLITLFTWPTLLTFPEEKLKLLVRISPQVIEASSGNRERVCAEGPEFLESLVWQTHRAHWNVPELREDLLKAFKTLPSLLRDHLLIQVPATAWNKFYPQQVMALREMTVEKFNFLGADHIRRMNPPLITAVARFSLEQLRVLDIEFFLPADPHPFNALQLLFHIRLLRPSLIEQMGAPFLAALFTRDPEKDEILRTKIIRTRPYEVEDGQINRESYLERNEIMPDRFFPSLNRLTDEEALTLCSSGTLVQATCSEIDEIVTERERRQRRMYVEAISSRLPQALEMQNIIQNIPPEILAFFSPGKLPFLGLDKLRMLTYCKDAGNLSRALRLGQAPLVALSASAIQHVFWFKDEVFEFFLDPILKTNGPTDELVTTTPRLYNAFLVRDHAFLNEGARAAAIELPLDSLKLLLAHPAELSLQREDWIRSVGGLEWGMYGRGLPLGLGSLFRTSDEKVSLLATLTKDSSGKMVHDMVFRIGDGSFQEMTSAQIQACAAQKDLLALVKSPNGFILRD